MKIFGRKNSDPAPDFMPVLSPGGHVSPSQGACMMEYISVLAGEKFSDAPKCVNPYIAAYGAMLNDESYSNRLALVRLMGPAMTTGTGNKSVDNTRGERLQTWAMENGLVGPWWVGNRVGDLEKIIAKYHEWYGTEPHVITQDEVERVEKVGLPA